MKKLLLFLPIIVFMFGQACEKKEKPDQKEFTGIYSPKHGRVLSFDSTSIKIKDVELVTVDLLMQYKRHCESEMKIGKVTNKDGDVGIIYIWDDGSVIDWNPKTPTFEDFLNWIKERK